MATRNPTMKEIREHGERKSLRGAARSRAKVGGVTCGAKKRHGGQCMMAAGWGTDHPGIGKCKMHGGSTPNHVRAAATEEYRKLLGSPREINPVDALLECIKIRAGEVQWLSDRMAELEKKEWVEDTLVGKQFHLYARERRAAVADLARYSQMAISLGIAERAVKMAETYAELLANYTQGIISALWDHLDEAGRNKVPQIVRAAMMALDGGVQEQANLGAHLALNAGQAA